jgi:ADP-ribosylglycohydrolase
MVFLEDRYIATMVLHALGDTIGFKNGDWKYNYFKEITIDTSLELIYEFISLGGINGINLNEWHVSADTLFHLATANAIIVNKTNKYDTENFLNIFKGQIIDYVIFIEMEIKKYNKNRYPHYVAGKYILQFKNGIDARTSPYDEETITSDVVARSPCIGLAFFGEENRDQLIEVAITMSKITHNSPLGYLSAVTIALFIAFAIENIHIYKWPILLLDLMTSNKIKQYIKTEQENIDYELYLKYWRRYIDTRFSKDKEPIKTKAHTNILFRTRYYQTNFVNEKRDDETFAGFTGYSAIIMAYDCLIDAEDKWEKLVIYSMLHIGDSSTVGAIAGSLYGAVYGYGDVPVSQFRYLEQREKLESYAQLIYKKFFLKQDITKYIIEQKDN